MVTTEALMYYDRHIKRWAFKPDCELLLRKHELTVLRMMMLSACISTREIRLNI